MTFEGREDIERQDWEAGNPIKIGGRAFYRAESWWDQTAEGSSYVFAGLFIALAVCLGILVDGLL